MINILATQTVLYQVNFDAAIAIPIVIFLASFIAVMIREFTKGFLRYIIFAIFIISSVLILFVIYLDSTPYNYIVGGAALLGGALGFFPWVKDLIKDIRN